MIGLAGSAAHVVVDDLALPVLSDTDAHHLARVLRLRNGESVTATDGRGSYRWCTWSDGGLEAAGDIEFVQQLVPSVGVAFAIVKGDRLDWIVQKLTEVGVDRMLPIAAQRCVVQWDRDKAAAQVERLRRIAREAAMQSRRVWLPEIEPLTKATDVLREPGVLRADLEGDELSAHLQMPDGVLAGAQLASVVIAVGPEGGWSPEERNVPGRAVRLGDTVLRTETAAIAAGVLLVDRRSTAKSG